MEFFNNYCKLLSEALNKIDGEKLEELGKILSSAQQDGHQVFLIGNGGSCASASHWVCDMGKGASVEGKPKMKIMALADNGALLTALGNDISYDEVFTYQLENFAQKDDVVVALSASGNSPNLVSAFNYAKSIGCTTVSIIGDFNGKLIDMSDLAIVIPSQNYGVIEDAHMVINHALSQYIRKQNEGK